MNGTYIFMVAICREAHKNRGTDRELVGLAKYLTLIAKLDDFSNLRWKWNICKYNMIHES